MAPVASIKASRAYEARSISERMGTLPSRDAAFKVSGQVARDIDLAAAGGAAGSPFERFAAVQHHGIPAETLYRTIGKAVDYGVWITEVTGRTVYLSPVMLDTLGVTLAEAQDCCFMSFVHPDERGAIIEDWADGAATATQWRREYRVRSKDGAWFHVLSLGRPVRDVHGVTTAWAGVMLDITELKATESALRQAVRDKGRLLAAAGHDLKQPLQAILGSLERMASLDRAEDRAVWAQHGGLAVSRMSSALDSLLASSRLESGNLQPVIEAVPVAHIIAELRASFAEQAQQKGLRLILRPCTATVRTDGALLLTIMANLVSNAIKYTDCGGVLVGWRRRGALLSIEVVDTGIGITAQDLPRIFDEFHQVDGTRDGFGLGLSIVRRAAGLLGHGLGVQSRPGRGSRFTIAVPLA